MADLTELILQLSTGRCIAWVGSGPSCEMGLPNWQQLANKVLEECRKRQRGNFSRIEEYYQLGQYREMFERVERNYGRAFLLETCEGELSDPGGDGQIYNLLAKLNFLAYFTTNFDDILHRHLENNYKAVQVFGNSNDDLLAVDIDTTPSLVKLHGRFSEPESLILTRDDYQKFYV